MFCVSISNAKHPLPMPSCVSHAWRPISEPIYISFGGPEGPIHARAHPDNAIYISVFRKTAKNIT